MADFTRPCKTETASQMTEVKTVNIFSTLDLVPSIGTFGQNFGPIRLR